jgi:L-ascorbate metabolism protein UlaG (beta-lactamase superfamily)
VRIRWYGQSAFLISAERKVFVDPFGDMQGLAERGMQFDYPPIEGVEADLLLVTHEHIDHNGVEAIGGEQAAAIAARLEAQVIVPMHYRTERVSFLEPVDAFVQGARRVERLESSAFYPDALAGGDGPLVVVPAAP